MNDLPANKRRGLKHAGMIFLIGGMESVSRALVHGDGFEDEQSYGDDSDEDYDDVSGEDDAEDSSADSEDNESGDEE